ncbi:hypothetical protein M3J09_004135 [Ascochyta lentis]
MLSLIPRRQRVAGQWELIHKGATKRAAVSSLPILSICRLQCAVTCQL